MTKVLVTGGRKFNNKDFLISFLRDFHREHKIEWLINGTAVGLDILCEKWTRSNQINYIGIPSKWNLYGNHAGNIRNREMADFAISLFPDIHLLSFPGNTGTADMTEYCKSLKIPITHVQCKHPVINQSLTLSLLLDEYYNWFTTNGNARSVDDIRFGQHVCNKFKISHYQVFNEEDIHQSFFLLKELT